MFKVGDTVVYGTNGTCEIVEISEFDFTGEKTLYYVLRPKGDKSSLIYVPTDNKDLTSKMKYTLDEDEIRKLIESVADFEPLWVDNAIARKQRCRDIVASGDRRELICMVKNLYHREKQMKAKGGKLNMTDEQYYRTAIKMLCDEFSDVLKISHEKLIPILTGEKELPPKASA
ncbi:MAG: CarD family transcriptional regulator [Clostridiales bacterium]|nr:CarD family transcriptional regulator [Clostridiales bacterium]